MQGLENLGSTCAINSLVQIICRNNYLRNIILEYDLKKDGIADNLKEILVLMHEKKNQLKNFKNDELWKDRIEQKQGAWALCLKKYLMDAIEDFRKIFR